jgi:hypothetical protein
MEVGGQVHAAAPLTHGERGPGTHCIGSWMGPRGCLDAVHKGITSGLCYQSKGDFPVFEL